MLLRWRDLLLETDPDVIIGYNTTNFDLPYLYERAQVRKEGSRSRKRQGRKLNVLLRRHHNPAVVCPTSCRLHKALIQALCRHCTAFASALCTLHTGGFVITALTGL